MSDHCKICLLRGGDHLEWCWEVRKARKQAFLEAAEIVRNHGLLSRIEETELSDLLREKAEE